MNMKLSVKGLALAFGLVEALGLLILGLLAMAGYGTGLVEILGAMAIGYDASIFGAIIGGIWGFVDGLIGGAIFAKIYNHFA